MKTGGMGRGHRAVEPYRGDLGDDDDADTYSCLSRSASRFAKTRAARSATRSTSLVGRDSSRPTSRSIARHSGVGAGASTSRSCVSTPNALATIASRDRDGTEVPRSRRLMVSTATPARSASCACVRPSRFRRSAIVCPRCRLTVFTAPPSRLDGLGRRRLRTGPNVTCLTAALLDHKCRCSAWALQQPTIRAHQHPLSAAIKRVFP